MVDRPIPVLLSRRQLEVVLSTTQALEGQGIGVTGGYRKPSIGPLYDLEVCKRDIASLQFRFGDSVRRRLRADFGEWVARECDDQIRKVVASLSGQNFCHVESWPQQPRGIVRADVYAIRDEFGLWYVKFAVTADGTRLFSCHLAECDMTLASGVVLRVSHV
jgi:hypothetical protein